MKKIFIALFSVLMVAGFAYAAEEEAGTMFDFSGMINTAGVYVKNDSGVQEDAYDYGFYEQEFDADLKITPSDKSLVFLNMEIHDESWLVTPYGSDDKTGDDNIMFKRAYGKYTFDNGMSTTFGLMTGGAFGTAFADSGDGRYRWRVDGVAGFGAWGVILEKNLERGDLGSDDNDYEKDDSEANYGYWVGKFGDVTPMVLVGYQTVGDVQADIDNDPDTPTNNFPYGQEEEDADIKVMLIQVAVTGSAGAIGYEAEFDYVDYKAQWDDSDDWSLWGAYGNVWMTMDAIKVGGYVAYGSYDEDTGNGFDMGADFYFGEGIGESQAFGGVSSYPAVAPPDNYAIPNNAGGFKAVTLLGAYADYSINDAMSLYGNFSYWMSNEEDYKDVGDSPWKDSTGYELTGRFAYQLADNVSYTVGAAYGAFKTDSSDYEDPDPYMRAFHRIQVNF
jgi:hypothetical protein